MRNIKIKDLYSGKPDAKDEVDFLGRKEFIETFVVADHFNIDSLLDGQNCFVTGFKGTGKTALLFYLDSLLRMNDQSCCSSFVLFKEEYTDTRKSELNVMSQQILSSISIDKEVLVDSTEFEYIWRWLLFKRIVADNEEFSNGLFLDNSDWNEFYKLISRIKAPTNKKKSVIPHKFKLSAKYTEPITLSSLSPEIEIDLLNKEDENYTQFTAIIDLAEQAFSRLKRTDIPYYIFVDELEAYYGEESVFKRDLCLIRDLLFTVKRFNTLFTGSGMKRTKVICAVRTEILTAINRFIVTKELNKLTSGFSVPLAWNYSNTNSYAHPIIEILLKRIKVCEDSNDSYKDTYQRWFPEQIHKMEPASYILNNSWYKPRDIVRLVSSAQNSIKNNSSTFSAAVFDSISKQYSEDSLTEIKEELRALYNADEIDTIISCFMGYKTRFSVNQLKKRIEEYFPATILETKFTQVINDLYRLGVLGNYLPVSETYRWQHKDDDRVVLTAEWRLMVHYALHRALSLGGRQDFGLSRNAVPETGDVVIATIYKVIKSFALAEFEFRDNVYRGSIHISEFKKLGYGYIRNIYSIVSESDQFKVSLGEYEAKYNSWRMVLIQSINI